MVYQRSAEPSSKATKPPNISQVRALPVSNSARARTGPDQHQRDHHHLDLGHQLDGRPSWIHQHGDAKHAVVVRLGHNGCHTCLP